MTKFLLRGYWVLLLATSTEGLTQFKFNNLDTGARLPKPMSDVSAVVGPDNLIYIAGGCDSPFGSRYDDEIEGFRCNSVSDAFYAFDPATQQFFDLPPMPEARFRHAAVSVNNQIWLVGGRDQNDELIGNVHVYDLEDQRWRTFRDLHESYWLSDLGGFSARGRAWFVGGFTQDYRSVRKVFSINPKKSWEDGLLRIVRHTNLLSRRGDVGVTVDAEERFAYVSGGSSHTNNFCSPLSTVEKYDLVENTWEEVAPLTQGRTGKTVIQLNDQIVALGGAQQISKLCNNKTISDPSDLQTPVYGVEVYDQEGWTVVDNLADYRFRSTSVVYNGTVYSFGGQSVYFSVCSCHPTVDTIVTYKQVDDPKLPTEPGHFFSMEQTYDFNHDEGADSLYENWQLQEKSNFDGEKYSEGAKDVDTETESTTLDFGGYHRDKSNGFNAYSGASTTASSNFLVAAVIAVMSVFVL